MQGFNYNLTRGLVAKLSKMQGPKCKWSFHISKRRRFKGHCSSPPGNVFAHDVPLIYARRCKGVGWLIKIEHSKEKKKGRNKRGRLEKKRLSFLCFFSKKQRRLKKKATSSGGRKQLAHQSSITSPFPCF